MRASAVMHLPGYSLETELYRGRKRVVYRARRDADGASVIIKTFVDELPAPADVTALRREHDIIVSLVELEGVARVAGMVMARGVPALVLLDHGGTSLKPAIPRPGLPLGQFLDLAVQITTTVAGLHRRGVIHRDINPHNLLLDPDGHRLTLIDFGLATRMPSHSPRLGHPGVLEGTIAYISPEQTGRMNREIDHRTDCYSLGVTLFEMLTGRLPFESGDPLEVIHGHIARTPPLAHTLRPDVPEALSAILLKLMAKTPEERYQSAFGLRADLEVCRAALVAGTIPVLTPGDHDMHERFEIPHQLYGRTEEVEALRQAFDKVLLGPPGFLVVAGYSGVGKTSLVREFYKPLVRRRGYFIEGKFDQLRRLPFSALIQAFRELVRQLLTEEEEQLAAWRARLAEALGSLGGIVAEVIPEIELILGPQAVPAPLGATEAQSRFRLVFQRFVQALARKEQPLVVFLDDLQWADSATLDLLTPLLTSPDIHHLFLVGAYRDNEVDAAHPLLRTLAALEQEGVRLDRVGLQPLDLAALSTLIGDTLHRGAGDVAPLARLVLQKTGGNPFFVIQFLKALHEAGFIVCSHEQQGWSFDVAAIAGAGMTDNVIELMTRKIQRLSFKAQSALTLGACIGNQFDVATLAVVSSQSPAAARDDLQEALEEGLVTVGWLSGEAANILESSREPDESISFLHDRVQQAAYALIPEERRQSVHLAVGRLLLARWDPETSDERLFEIVQHLNLGRAGVVDASEGLQLAGLNLAAGRKAKNSTAYQAADGYLRAGLSLLPHSSWDEQYELTFDLHLEAAEVAHLCGAEASADELAATLLARARSRLDEARVHVLRTVRFEYLSRYPEAIRAGRQGLALFGEDFPDGTEARQAALAAGQVEIDRLIGGRSIASLIDLPQMVDPETRAVMKLLTSLHTPCYLSGDKTLTMLNTAALVRLSLRHGHLEDSAHAYVLYAMVVGPILGRPEEAFEFGQLAIRLSERFGDPGLRAKVHMNFSWNVSLWRRPFEESLAHARTAFRLGNESGRLSDAVYALFNETYFTLLSAPQLEALHPLQEAHALITRRSRMDFFADGPQVIFQWGRALQGRTLGPTRLDDQGFSEEAYLAAHAGQRLFLMFFYVAKLALRCLYGEYAAARSAATEAGRAIEDYTGTIWDELRTFYLALTLASLHDDAAASERDALVAEIRVHEARLAHWAEHSPANFQVQHLLVRAELARVEGAAGDAARLYEQAITDAGHRVSPFERALANERYAEYLRGLGLVIASEGPAAEARIGYAEWGAAPKVAQLEAVQARRASPATWGLGRGRGVAPLPVPTQISTEASPGTLDLGTVMKAAHALSGEIELEALLVKLMQIAIENAGAERGVLLLEQEGVAWVRAEGSIGVSRVHAMGAVPLAEGNLASSIVTYVRRTSESVVLADARTDGRFGDDGYLDRVQPRSILCTPVLNQGRQLGVLYLENNLVPGAFTAERTEVLQVLAAHAAIAIENARMFAEIRGLKDRLQAENVYLIEEIKTQHGFEEIVGRTPALQKVLSQVEQVAPTDSTVLITGETGTGKELVARALHNLSRRKDRPLVTVNCGAISAGLVESELFGHEKGAFTGAITRKIGRFELADGGTIFLDEIGDLQADLQVKLLRVLQEGEIERVGGSRAIKVDVRVIAATHRDLGQLVQLAGFRADLFYRLNVFPIRTPTLRERREDIPLLVRYFVLKYAQKLGKRIESIPAEVMEPLCSYAWPGNVRELGNVLERSVIITRGPVLELGEWIPTTPSPTANGGHARSLEDLQREHIVASLERAGWKVSGAKGAAAALGLKPTTLESRMKKLGIRRPS